jgi:hypothetical protein
MQGEDWTFDAVRLARRVTTSLALDGHRSDASAAGSCLRTSTPTDLGLIADGRPRGTLHARGKIAGQFRHAGDQARPRRARTSNTAT